MLSVFSASTKVAIENLNSPVSKKYVHVSIFSQAKDW